MPGGFLTAIAAVVNILFLFGGIYIYLALVRQLQARLPDFARPAGRRFGFPEVILAVGLTALFLFNAWVAYSRVGKPTLGSNDLLANALISLALFLFVAAFLKFRGLAVVTLAGFAKLPVWRAILTGVVLLFAAYPLIFVADLISQQVLGSPSSRQSIVEIFSESHTIEQRILIIVMAVSIAPLVEEFVFRFFFYGVVRRYLGRVAGLVANSVLFAVVHAHLPSAMPLFMLGACLTLAYEWSGSILVPMTMHALFNAITLAALAFPELLQQ